jgi:protein-S-isoprenylcysteine O-methyltransferase Ste14
MTSQLERLGESQSKIMKDSSLSPWLKRLAARSGAVLFMIVAFEILIMISPFAFFFYSVFNPVLHWLGGFRTTMWLTAFFLPHMILPPTFLLKSIRVAGSVLFSAGFLAFTTCALQVYLGKMFKWGIAGRGLYGYIRHPQYLALGLWGFGMAIMWPRFLVLATLALMLVLYYMLAGDEERRMLARFGEDYRAYMDRTGMFFPRSVETWLAVPLRPVQNHALRHLAVVLLIPAMVLGSGFLMREITLDSIPFKTSENMTLISILPEDSNNDVAGRALNMIATNAEQDRLHFLHGSESYLVYLMRPDYVMQGMIADTGGQFHLHKQHHTILLITDWLLHPFEHLRRSPAVTMAMMNNADPQMAIRHHCPLSIDDPHMTCEDCPYRRLIFAKVENDYVVHPSERGVFAFKARRTPVGFADMNVVSGEIVKAQAVGKSTGWRDVPTPAI